MRPQTLSLVIVGHVDHGKSTLIGRLLFDTDSVPEALVAEVKAISEELGREMEFAYFLDALEEEREQNITIDTTQTFFSTEKREFIIIDAPGHKEFLKNMITGASMADAAVLMVDARLGLEEQTRRHAYILHLLGMQQVLVAVNKMDLVDYAEASYQEIVTKVSDFLSELDIRPLHFIPVSGRTGDNIVHASTVMDWYTGPTIIQALEEMQPAEVLLEKPFRFPIQDVYEVDGRKLAVGRVESGRIKSNQEVKLLPAGQSAVIKSIKVWKAEKEEASAGESLGFELDYSGELKRGQVLCASQIPAPALSIKATVFWLSESAYQKSESLEFRCATQVTRAVLAEIENRMDSSTLEILERSAEHLGEAEVADVRLQLESAVVVQDYKDIEELGRFVLVKGEDIVAGGIIHGWQQ